MTTLTFKGRRYTPQPFDPKLAARQRIGVPGNILYEQNSCIRNLLLWAGTSFQAVFTSVTCYIHLGLFVVLALSFTLIVKTTSYHSAVYALMFPPSAASILMTLTIFSMTFYVSQVFGRWNARFENICKLNGNVTRMTALSVATLSKKEALDVMRYTHAINHIYHLLAGSLSTFADREGYRPLIQRGLLTPSEVEVLLSCGSPGVVLYSWATRIINQSFTGSSKGSPEPILGSLEQCVGGTRGFAAKNIAYTRTQIPFIYFHFKAVLVNAAILCLDWDHAIYFARASSMSCDGYIADDLLLDELDTNRGNCLPGQIVVCVAEIVLVFLFLGLLFLSDTLSDMQGDCQCSYDPGVDLDGLWAESQNVINSIGQRPTNNSETDKVNGKEVDLDRFSF